MPTNPGTQITVTTSPTRLVVARSRAQRAYIYVENTSDKIVYIGVDNALVTTTTGSPLPAGAKLSILNTQNDSEATAAVYAVTATGAAVVLVTEGS